VRPAARRRLRLSYLTVRTMADAAKPTNMLSTKGQVIPPAATRRRHDWRPGTRLAVEDTADDIFLGRFGFFELYEPNGYDPAKLLEGLCREFRGDQLGFKPYACGCPQHAILDAAIGARGQLGLGTAVDLAEIADVQVPPPPRLLPSNSMAACTSAGLRRL